MAANRELTLDRESFLARYWQTAAYYMPGAIPSFVPPVDPDELAGLAMEEDVESRIVECDLGQWRQYHGPFEAADYNRTLPWTLLVQAVDHHIPEVAQLRQLVDFIPGWRMDDVMVSYAVDGGSVGPHCDNYDVFLLQGAGKRLWRLGQYCEPGAALLPHDELRILDSFECQEEYLLAPGDILYVPPGRAHWGIAEGECTTFSLGFRAPRVNDMVSRWADQLLEQLEPEQFYRDARREPVTRPGEITRRDIERAEAQLQAALDQASGDTWFGELVTEPRDHLPPDDDDLAEARATLREGVGTLELSPTAKLAWQHHADGVSVFANGECLGCEDSVLPAIMGLCARWRLEGNDLDAALGDPATMRLLDALLERGCLYVP